MFIYEYLFLEGIHISLLNKELLDHRVDFIGRMIVSNTSLISALAVQLSAAAKANLTSR